MKIHALMVVLLACLAIGAVHTQSAPVSGTVLDGVTIKATTDQAARLRAAIASSPQLQSQVKALVASGKLASIVVGGSAELPPKAGPFSAWVHGTTWAFDAGFIEQHGEQRLFDVIHPGDILPDNLVFALGHLAYKTQAMSEQIDPAAADARHLTKEQWIATMLNNDAAATIAAWNDTVDAAEQRNGGKPLSIGQAGDLLLNLRYRGPLVKALHSDPSFMSNGGRVVTAPADIAALATALSSSKMFDVQ